MSLPLLELDLHLTRLAASQAEQELAEKSEAFSLTWLTVSHCALENLTAVTPFTRLKVLDLSHNRLEDSGLMHLCGLGALRVLLLDHNQLQSVEAVCALQSLTRLRGLALHHNLYTQPYAQSVFAAFPALAFCDYTGRAGHALVAGDLLDEESLLLE